jgi:prepilin-type N-terminal cleavage/methylation domain-containing protein
MPIRRGFSLIELLGVLALMAIVGVALMPKIQDVIKRARSGTVGQQTIEFQSALNAWVARQASLASAAKRFEPDGDALVPKAAEMEGMLKEVCSILNQDHDSFRIDPQEPTHIISETLSARGAYIWISWPQPFRENHLQANLSLPE